jgi:hypothetical protein
MATRSPFDKPLNKEGCTGCTLDGERLVVESLEITGTEGIFFCGFSVPEEEPLLAKLSEELLRFKSVTVDTPINYPDYLLTKFL